MRAQIKDDMITGIASGDVAGGELIPEALASLPQDQLRFVDGKLVDAGDFSEFFIDQFGSKHIANAEGRQPLQCQWSDKLVRRSGTWRVKSAADDLKTYAADARYVKEITIITVNGYRIQINRAAQGQITSALAFIQMNSAATVNWKSFGDGWVVLDAAKVTELAQAMLAHVESCFDVERQVNDDIDAGTITTEEEIDAAFAVIPSSYP
jgi:Domain of unknown function (DUF4376)